MATSMFWDIRLWNDHLTQGQLFCVRFLCVSADTLILQWSVCTVCCGCLSSVCRGRCSWRKTLILSGRWSSLTSTTCQPNFTRHSSASGNFHCSHWPDLLAAHFLCSISILLNCQGEWRSEHDLVLKTDGVQASKSKMLKKKWRQNEK